MSTMMQILLSLKTADDSIKTLNFKLKQNKTNDALKKGNML